MEKESGCFPLLLLLGLGAWFVFGDPPRTVANWWWPETAAPWETVDAFFYPDRNNLSLVEHQTGLESVNACHDWVNRAAVTHGDASMERSDWECGLGKPTNWNGLNVYRETVK